MVSLIFAPIPSDVSLVFVFFIVLGITIVILFCVMAVWMMAASSSTVITYFPREWICWPFFERCELDIEFGRRESHRARIITYQAIEIENNNRTSSSDILGLPSSIEETRELRQQTLEKQLQPAVIYGSKETLLDSGDCSICLDDYRDGEFCRVFPVCNHMFHVKCIDRWLKNQLTCPVCRKCLLNS